MKILKILPGFILQILKQAARNKQQNDYSYIFTPNSSG